MRDDMGTITGVIQGDTGSLDDGPIVYSSRIIVNEIVACIIFSIFLSMLFSILRGNIPTYLHGSCQLVLHY